ncbi:MAG: hypothetical protein COW88_02285 [Candidatus Lloydbacteria bacterium CG22_combo_CG10-13_8_21_14_all_47_15]|uniref:Purple acid phosphatase N-terminal domain-containing protein n=1 Tax=Candidatus Lloydbacteria bacterium CG22_combo_CG10-13_8_21_14_all_47_15 TaxID=1974635 RepID=A0A2H0CTT6_9BACT|nr:MAG: hypothetical protein COW88_02285 [Candidatus Lloydbacteria bacterium CG22_combo_CG10-13_8_21_14_all_47_15]
MNNNIDEQLKKMKRNPLSQKEKEMLWSRIQTRIEKKSIFNWLTSGLPISFSHNSRFMLALALALILASSGAGTVLAANNAKPGDILFPIDIAAEKIRLVISTKDKQDMLRVQFAEERLHEVRILIAFENSPGDNTAGNKQTASSTAASATSTDTIASSTPSRHSKKTEKALAQAIAHLEKAQNILEEHGNSEALASLETVIADFSAQYQYTGNQNGNIEKIKEIKVKVKEKKERIEIVIQTKKDNERKKFELEDDDGDSDKDEEDNESDDDEDGDSGQSNSNDEKGGSEHGNKVIVCHKDTHTIRISENALPTHLAHGDEEGRCDTDASGNDEEYDADDDEEEGDADDDDNEDDNEDDNTATSTPDTTAPVLSNIFSAPATSTNATTTAEISWHTDESATSKVSYSVTTGFFSSSTAIKSSIFETTLVLTHILKLSDLNASTTYYFIVESSDVAGNTATSSEHSFTTS